jgi:hypothetical protein
MVVAETRHPTLSSSSWVRRSPHRGFSRAKRRISPRSSSDMDGRPRRGRKRKADQCLRHFPMPAEQRCGREEQAPRWQSTSNRGQDHPVSGQQDRPLDLTTQTSELVAEREDLEVALGI